MNGISFYRKLLDSAYARFPAYPEGRYRDRGIVLCAGGPIHLANAYVCLKFLRTFTDLPIELFYADPAEMPDAVQYLLGQDFAPITLTDISSRKLREEQTFLPIHNFRGCQIKPFALLYSSFEEIFYIDVDNIPLQSPVPLFTSAEYLQTGALFWQDLAITKSTTEELFQVFGVTAETLKRDLEFESGQLVIDKRRCWKALLTVCLANSDVENFREYCYNHTLGDKDTFRLAFQFAYQPYYLVQQPALQVGSNYFIIPIPLTNLTIKIQHDLGSFYATGILQHDLEGRPLFAHKTVCEWDMYQRFRNLLYIESPDRNILPAADLADWENRGYEYLEEFRKRYMGFFARDYLREFRGLLARWIIAFLDGVKYWQTGKSAKSPKP